MENITIVSADGHVGCRYEGYRPYIDPKFRDLLDELEEEDSVTLQALQITREMMSVPELDQEQAPQEDEISDIGSIAKRRLQELDKEGIAAELLLVGASHTTPFFFEGNKPYPADVRAAGAKAYNRWLADLVSEGEGRLVANGYLGPCTDMDATLAELKWLADHGFASIEIPGSVSDPALPPLYSPYYDKLWAACADMGIVLLLHAGWGMTQGVLFEVLRKAAEAGVPEGAMGADLETTTKSMMEMGGAQKLDMDAEGSPFALDMGPRQALWQLMLAGVFDRNPTLKMVLTEVRADWVPPTLAYLDKRIAQHPGRPKLLPSEYFSRNFGVTPSSPRLSEIKMRLEIGIDQLMFGADIPHPESTWPDTRQWINYAFAGVPEEETRKILGGNAIRTFNLDGAKLDAVASRVGSAPDAVFAGIDLVESTLTHFDKRSGYLRPPEQVDTSNIAKRLMPTLL